MRPIDYGNAVYGCEIRRQSVCQNHHFADHESRRRVGIDLRDLNLATFYADLELSAAECDCAAVRACVAQLFRDAVKCVESGVAFYHLVRLVIGKPLLDMNRGERDSIAGAVCLLVKSHFDREGWPGHCGPQACQVRRQALWKHWNRDGWQVNGRRSTRGFCIEDIAFRDESGNVRNVNTDDNFISFPSNGERIIDLLRILIVDGESRSVLIVKTGRNVCKRRELRGRLD